MAALNATADLLGLGRRRWLRVGAGTLTTAAAWVLVASTLLALNRFGGLATSEPRGFVRLTLVGVWGWIGMSAIAWAVTALPVARGGIVSPLATVLAVVGTAHVTMIALAATLFVAAGALQLLWPGLVMAVFVFVFWFPASVFRGLTIAGGVGTVRAVAATTTAYAAWLAVVGRELQRQLGHLV